MDFLIPTISIIGFGETGSLIASLINQSRRNLSINIMDPSDNIEGRLLDMKHAGVPQNNKIQLNNTELLSKSQLIFYTAGVRGEPGENRMKRAFDNLNIIEDVFDGTELLESALIISISNPVEATAQWIHETTNEKIKIISTGTLLDTFRLQNILSTHFDEPLSAVETMVAGEHGTKMFPIWSQTKIRDKHISSLASEEQLEKFTLELKASATKIRGTEKATKYGVAQAAIFLAKHYFSQEEVILPCAFNAKNFIGKDIFVNWPCRLLKQHITPARIKLNSKEKILWDLALESIEKTTYLKPSKET